MKTVLFVCTGNVCRSPMAEGLFRRAIRSRDGYRILSAGLGAVDGQPPSPFAVKALAELGIDVSGLRSCVLTGEMVNEADYIFGMTHGHVETVIALYPQATEKTFLLREFDETLDAFEKDITDPIGGSYEVYVNCRDQIEQGIVSMLKFMDQTAGAPGAVKPAASKPTIALGADHGGYDLKEAVKQHLQTRGINVTDFGAKSKEASDYPDLALPVARSVAEHRQDLGILVCTTGIGMSIAANKVPGVRAALVWDERMAEMARRHNDANVLCLGGKSTDVELAQKMVDSFLAAQFEGGRHERRLNKLQAATSLMDLTLSAVDSEVAKAIEFERQRQEENIELIASELHESGSD